MTIEATFANASLISPSTCSFAALSIVAPVAWPETDNPLDRADREGCARPRCAPGRGTARLRRLLRTARLATHGRTDVAGFFDGGWVSGSVVQWVGSWAGKAMGRAVVTTMPPGDHSACCAVN